VPLAEPDEPQERERRPADHRQQRGTHDLDVAQQLGREERRARARRPAPPAARGRPATDPLPGSLTRNVGAASTSRRLDFARSPLLSRPHGRRRRIPGRSCAPGSNATFPPICGPRRPPPCPSPSGSGASGNGRRRWRAIAGSPCRGPHSTAAATPASPSRSRTSRRCRAPGARGDRQPRHRHRRPADHRVRHRGAEAEVPAAHLELRGPVVLRLLRARAPARTWHRSARPRRWTATTSS
jgi:hypothetical protein